MAKRWRDAAATREPPAWQRWALPSLLLVALVTRVGYFVDIRDNPFFDGPVIDAQFYDTLGRNLAHDQGTGAAPFMMPPFYPLLLSLVYRFLGESYLTAHLLQFALGIGIVWLTFLIGKRVASVAVGWIAALFIATSKALLFVEGDLLATPLAVFLDLAFLLCGLRLLQGGGLWNACGAGVAAGLAALTRPSILIVAVPFAGWLLRRRQRWRLAAVFGVAMALTIAPVTLHNWRASGEFVPISANGGINLYIGNNPDMPRTVTLRPGPAWRVMNDLPVREAGKVRAQERDRWFYGAALRFWIEQPLLALRFTCEKALLLIGNHEIMRDVDFYYFAEHYARLLRLPGWNFAFLLALACIGAACGRLQGLARRALLLYLLLYAAGIVVFFVTARYRVPLLPILALFAAEALVWGRERLRTRDWRRLGGATALGATVFAISMVDWLNVNAVDQIEARYRVATAFENKGDFQEALLRYDDVLRDAPMHALAAGRAAALAQRLGQLQEAVDRIERLLEHHPDYVEPMLNLANLAWAAGDTTSARHYFELALHTDPWFAQAHGYFGMYLLAHGRAREALQRLDRALALDPAWLWLRIERARALLALDDPKAALAEIDSVAARLPPSAALFLVRGDALARLGQRLAAEACWQEGLALEPSHPELRRRLGERR